MIEVDAIVFLVMAYGFTSFLFRGDEQIVRVPMIFGLTNILGIYIICTGLTILVLVGGVVGYYALGVIFDFIGIEGILYHFAHQGHFSWEDFLVLLFIVCGTIIARVYFMQRSVKGNLDADEQ